VLAAGYGDAIFLLSSRGDDPVHLSGFAPDELVEGGAFSPSGRLVAAASESSAEGQPALRIWDLELGTVSVFDLPQPEDDLGVESAFTGIQVMYLAFADENTVYTSGGHGLLRWDLETGSNELISNAAPGALMLMRVSTDRSKILTFEGVEVDIRGKAHLYDVSTGQSRPVEIPGETWSVGLGPKGETWAAGEDDGLIWVGRFDGGHTHVLAGHEGPITSLAISPDLKWIASSGEDKTLRLWPMPDLLKPPLHTLPHDELIAKLKTLTNLRVVRDEESSTGWKLTHDPFPGWEMVPEW
jgi:WD40 repeat protein